MTSMAFIGSLKEVFGNRRYALLAVSLSVAISIAYLYMLNLFHESFILFGSLFIGSLAEVTGIILLGVMFAISTSMYIYIAKRDAAIANGRTKNATFFGLILGTSSQLLCCTPIVPFALSAFGASTPVLFSLTGKIQGFFANTWIIFIIVSLSIMAISLYYISGKVWKSCCKNKIGVKE